MLKDRDRTELRLLLVQHKLLFLRPKYREERLIEEEKGNFLRYDIFVRYLKITLGLEAKEIYRSIKDRCRKDVEFGNSAGAIINLLWENRIDAKKNMPVRDHFY